MSGEVTEADLIRANKALRYQLGADDALRVAEALAEERERARAPFLALAERWERMARYGTTATIYGAHARRLRRAAEDAR